MNPELLSSLFSGSAFPSGLGSELEAAIKKHPYFSNLYIVRAKVLHDQQDERFTQALNQAATRTISRKRLKHLIEGPVKLDFVWNEKTDFTPKAEIEPETLFEPMDSPEVIEFEPIEVEQLLSKEEIAPIEHPSTEQEKRIEKNEFGFRFVKKPKTPATKNKVKTEEKAFEIKSLEKKQPLQKRNQKDAIDFFLEKAPSISSPKIDFGQSKEQPDLSVKSVSLGEEIVTENMALIYMKQRNFARALDIYRKLELKFPEKRSYFAALIKNLENTIV